MKEKILTFMINHPILSVILVVIVGGALEFGLVAAAVKLASTIFGFKFKWVIVVFIWLVVYILQNIFGKAGGNGK